MLAVEDVVACVGEKVVVFNVEVVGVEEVEVVEDVFEVEDADNNGDI